MPMPKISHTLKRLEPYLLFSAFSALWIYAPAYLRAADDTVGMIDQSILLLVLLSIMIFLIVLSLCWWLMQHFLQLVGLPSINNMVSHFNLLELWQKFILYTVLFWSLVWGFVLTILAIC